MKYIPILFIIFIVACEQVVEIDVPDHDPQIVLSSYYKSGDTRLEVYLTKSLGILTNGNADNITGANVELYENDVSLGELTGRTDTIYYYTNYMLDSLGSYYPTDSAVRNIQVLYRLELPAPLQANKIYKLTAEAEGFESVSATQRLPSTPDVSGLIYKPMSRVSFDGYLSDAFDFDIHDKPDEDNYYGMEVYECGIGANCYDRWTSSFTPGTERGRNGMILKDDLFEGKTYGVELLAEETDTSHVDLKVVVSAISRERYLFSKSVEAYWTTEGNPFAEPVIIHTNVENGQGIFSMESVAELIVE